MTEKIYDNNEIARRLLTNGTTRHLRLMAEGKDDLAIGDKKYPVEISGMIGIVNRKLIWWNLENYSDPQEFDFAWNEDKTACLGYYQRKEGDGNEIVVTPGNHAGNVTIQLVLCFETAEQVRLLYFHSAGGSYELAGEVQRNGMRESLWDIFDMLYDQILTNFKIEKLFEQEHCNA